MYQVIKEFYDLQDATDTKSGVIYHHYQVGDTYPRKGLNPSEGRVAELAGPDNAQGRPLIRAVGVPPAQDTDSGQDDSAPAEEVPSAEEQEEKAAAPKKKASKKAATSE